MGLPRLEEIRTRREALGISLKKFGEMAGIKSSFLSMIETRKANPNFNLLETIFLTLDQEEKHALKAVKTIGQFSKNIVTVSKNESITKTISIMYKNDFSQLPVFSNLKCVGIITERSITKYLLENPGALDAYTSVEEIMDFPPPIIDFNYKITPVLLELLSEHNCLLVSENGKITSLITKIDAIRSLIKKMTKKDKEKIKELIRHCKIYRYSTDETLNYLKEHGHEISDRTLRRIKNDMHSKLSERFIEIAKYEWVDEMLRSIDTLKELEKESWKLLSQKPSISERIRIFNSIGDIQTNLLTVMNNTSLIEKIKHFFDSRLAEYEKLEQKPLLK